MVGSRRSASVGALPHEKKHFVSRHESASGASLDVRCACQYYQCDSLLPDRVNPVDSRSSSKLGFHSDASVADLEQFHPTNLAGPDTFHHRHQHQHQQQHHRDDLSRRSFEVTARKDSDRLSMHSVQPANVDLSFVEKYPELEHIARSRGLVVRSISDANETELPCSQTFLAGHRRRQLSVGGLSAGSGRTGYQRDPETLSMHSGTSLRRIICANSKSELYVADINIPNTRTGQREQRSISTSRRTSNADLFQASILPIRNTTGTRSLTPPQLKLIAATPSPAVTDMKPDFQRQRSPSPATASDFRNAKPPLSVDYMRPSEQRQTMVQGDILPQNQPIDVSKYGGDTLRPSFLYESDYKNILSNHEMPPTTQATPSQDSLQQTVAKLEEIAATHNLVEIRDNIQTETQRPPSIGDNLSAASLNLTELTKIKIVSAVPVVDIDALIQNEAEKAVEQVNKRPRSPPSPPRRSRSPIITATLELPPNPSASAQTQTKMEQLKTQHTPERQLSSDRVNKMGYLMSSPGIDINMATINGAITVQEASPEVKKSYTSLFKSMFTSKGQESTMTRQKSPSPPKSPILKREKSPLLVQREKSPSPVPGKLLSVFSKPQTQTIEIVPGASTIIKKPEDQPLSVKVTETFSLKVDDMDQYCTRPPKLPLPPPHAQIMYSSREDFATSEHTSLADIKEAFAPVVVSTLRRSSFMAGNRNLYSSEIDSHSDFNSRGSTKEPSMGSRPLISVPINITDNGNRSGQYNSSRGRAPSEQRLGIQRKSSFREPRTLSYDRARITGSHENLYALSARMTKTVSFNFDERKSRLAEFESQTPLTQKQIDHREFLERTYFSRDHEYEPIAVTAVGDTSSIAQEAPPTHTASAQITDGASELTKGIETSSNELEETAKLQTELKENYQNPEVDDTTEFEKPEKKGFMASAQNRTRKMQDGLKNQAGKIRTKLRTQTKKAPSGSPKQRERGRLKVLEFSKLKMPEIKRPDMSKLREIKRPEFTKFNKPDMSKFKLPEKLKLKRSKSLKENETSLDETEAYLTTTEASTPAENSQIHRRVFEFNFGTYPRAFRKKKKITEPVIESSLGTEGPSIIPSTGTQPSAESSSSPQGDRGPGPVRSRWADKFSDVSYNDSVGSRYRRYGSEVESFERDSSLERRLKDDLEDTASEAAPDLNIIGGVTSSKQFAEFDEENRAIHEISNLRSREFKRRPIVHQDSDLRSEDSKDTEGWTEKEIQKNKLLRKAEVEAEASYYKYHEDESPIQDAQSTASSGKKVVMEEIDDDEFFLRKRGISEDNIELRQYISDAIREGYDSMPNALLHVGQGSQIEDAVEYGDYDEPPPKPRRLHKNYRPDYGDSQELQRSDYGDDFSMSQNGSDFLVNAPKRPMRKGRSRSKYSLDSQDIPMADESNSVQYFDDDEDYLRPPTHNNKENVQTLNNLDYAGKETYIHERFDRDQFPRPKPPKRQKKRARHSASIEKDVFINGFGGRSVSNTYLQPLENVIVYRTEHEYHIPLATPENYTDGTSASRSVSRYDEDDRTSHGADSLALDVQSKPETEKEIVEEVLEEKFVIDMMENDGYAVVRKEHMPKPTPPTRRKKFTRSPGERFTTLPTTNAKRSSPPPERPPPPQGYTPSSPQFSLPTRRRSLTSLDAKPDYDEDDYEEPEALERPESPRNLQSGEVINKMKFRPLPPPPRPPREKRHIKDERKPGEQLAYRYVDSEQITTSSTAESNDQNPDFEVEVSTQTDPLPDDFVCEEFEITDDMKVIVPRRKVTGKTLEDLLKNGQKGDIEQLDSARDDQLARSIQRFRDANQRSMSERSRASSQADRSKSLSRPQTPSAIIIERRVSTPAPSPTDEATIEAAIIVRPISDVDLEDDELRREKEELLREGLLSDSSLQSKSDVETGTEDDDKHADDSYIISSDFAASSTDLDAAIDKLEQIRLNTDYDTTTKDGEVARTLLDSEYEENDAAERYSQHYDEEEEHVAEKYIRDSLEKELRDQMEKEQLKRRSEAMDLLSEEEKALIARVIEQTAAEYANETVPQPPPRRKSATALETITTDAELAIVEQTTKPTEPVQSIAPANVLPQTQIPNRLGDLEVERLRVHALQAGQIMVSQLHGQQISADELDCKSGNLIVQSIELPPGFIEHIVERVRTSEPRTALLSAETQTSQQVNNELQKSQILSETEPKLQKPPRETKNSEAATDNQNNLDEQTQTDAAMLPLPPPPQVYPTVEYLQSLAPLAFYNLQRSAEAEESERKSAQKCRRLHLTRRARDTTASTDLGENEDELLQFDSDVEEHQLDRPMLRRSRTRSSTLPPLASYEPRTVTQAGRMFISACSLELVNIINQLTSFVRSGNTLEPAEAAEIRTRRVPALVVLFMIITFGLIVFLLTGRNVHIHHWDFFNLPGNEGRQM